jgi:hypothetical protein
MEIPRKPYDPCAVHVNIGNANAYNCEPREAVD